MTEDFLHYIWKYRQFEFSNLQTTAGEKLVIIHPGEHNHDAGPDFQNAKIKIGKTTWAGSVEIHIKSSDWIRHMHQNDAAYSNVILHVVYEYDIPVVMNNISIPTLEIKKLIRPKTLQGYMALLKGEVDIPCRNSISGVNRIIIRSWLDNLLVERLMQKSAFIEQQLQKTTFDWEESFYRVLARNFGMKVNGEAFEQLAASLPQIILAKHKSSLKQTEALLFGQAGLLQRKFKDEYPTELSKEYNFLRSKYNLSHLLPQVWKFSRLRPPNFPTIRIAQFAALVFNSQHLFSKILEADKLQDAEKYFQISPSKYWNNHWTFDKISNSTAKNLGQSSIHLLLINTIIPFIFYYGKYKGVDTFSERAILWLEQLPAESNTILNDWKKLNIIPENAAQSQALITLKNDYCRNKKCLDCAIGIQILKY